MASVRVTVMARDRIRDFRVRERVRVRATVPVRDRVRI